MGYRYRDNARHSESWISFSYFKAVLGGFVNGKKAYPRERGLLSKKRVAWWLKPEVVVLILERCTVPDDFQLERLDWVRQAAVL